MKRDGRLNELRFHLVDFGLVHLFRNEYSNYPKLYFCFPPPVFSTMLYSFRQSSGIPAVDVPLRLVSTILCYFSITHRLSPSDVLPFPLLFEEAT